MGDNNEIERLKEHIRLLYKNAAAMMEKIGGLNNEIGRLSMENLRERDKLADALVENTKLEEELKKSRQDNKRLERESAELWAQMALMKQELAMEAGRQ